MSEPFDPTKPCQTRAGVKVRILCTYAGGEYPIAGLVQGLNDIAYRWTSDGKFLTNGKLKDNDLINIPEKRKVWVNVYRDGQFVMFGKEQTCKCDCDNQTGGGDRIACVKVEFTEGEGL